MPTSVAEQFANEKFRLANALLVGLERQGKTLPGTREIVLKRVATTWGDSPRLLAEAIRYLFGSDHPVTGQHEPGPGAMYLDPAKATPDLPIRTLISALVAGNYVKSSASDPMFREFSVKVAGRDLASVAERIGGELLKRENNLYLAQPIGPTTSEVAVRESLEMFREMYPSGLRDGLVSEFAHLANAHKGPRLHRAVAEALTRRKVLHEGAAFDWSSPAFKDAPLTAADLAATGADYYRL